MNNEIYTLEDLKNFEEFLNKVRRRKLIEELKTILDKKLPYAEEQKEIKTIYELLDINYLVLENVRKEIAKKEVE